MTKDQVLKKIYKGLIVSCQALKNEPLYGSEIMAKMAIAAEKGGAVGIRANYATDIKAIREAVDLPIIGLVKREYPDYEVYITPTLKEVEEVVSAGANIVAIDATDMSRPGNKTASQFIYEIKNKFDIMVMADISTYEEAIRAQDAGADLISTTMSGYTPYSPKLDGPDFQLIQDLARDLKVPVIGEGRIWEPEEAVKALELGAYAIVVGTAITRPMNITKRFVDTIAQARVSVRV
ncbi:MAG: N-acetylmannosamine-6-phosphate 2-epimerase [Caldicoprobacterales bacterium]|jgi:N-acylglucosamine-6-phosphate 2-epimerase|nr:N-acetylmannosamine-6-phosphate 2-epimerase [Clostridiales bacterium]